MGIRIEVGAIAVLGSAHPDRDDAGVRNNFLCRPYLKNQAVIVEVHRCDFGPF